MGLEWIGAIAAALFGAVVGSFLNVVIHRLPRDQSIAFPASHCPACGTPIRPRDNIPVVGYLMLGGRCRACRQGISVRYPLVEALTAGLAAALWWRFGPGWDLLVYFVFVAGLVAVTFIDVDHKIIPDSLSLGGVAVGFVTSFLTPLSWLDSLLGVVAGGGVLLAVAVAYFLLTRREGMGLGDVKLLAAIGAFLGWQGVLFTVFVSSLVGSVVGLSLTAWRRSGLRLEVPFGPFLAAAAVLHLFAGAALTRWYFGLFG